MKYTSLLFSILFSLFLLSCDKDGDDNHTDGLPEYMITILSPTTDNLISGESFDIHVNFDEVSLLTVHHVNVQITNETGEVIYNMPTTAHVHADSGHHEHQDTFTPNVPAGSTLTLTAKVWGHATGISELTDSKTYTVN